MFSQLNTIHVPDHKIIQLCGFEPYRDSGSAETAELEEHILKRCFARLVEEYLKSHSAALHFHDNVTANRVWESIHKPGTLLDLFLPKLRLTTTFFVQSPEVGVYGHCFDGCGTFGRFSEKRRTGVGLSIW